MKLAKYLADYLLHEEEENNVSVLHEDYCEHFIQQGLDAFASTEDSIIVVSKLDIPTGQINETERYSY